MITQLNKIPDKHRLAFLDFVGIDFLPARPSRVPLTFHLAEGSRGGYVPPYTRVASSEDPDVIFETAQSLSVVAARLGFVFSLNPWQDKYTDHSAVVSGKEDGFRVFGNDPDEVSFDHALCLGDDNVLDMRRPPTELTVHFEGANLSSEYFSRWHDGMGNRIKNPHFGEDVRTDKLAVSLADTTTTRKRIRMLKRSAIDGKESFWLMVGPQEGAIVKGTALPAISKISVDVTVEDILPDATLFNNVPVEVKKGFYPFGNEPKKGDTLYIGSEEAFSKRGAEITLNIELDTQIEDAGAGVTLQWSYWNGKGWGRLRVTDRTGSFTRSDQVVIDSCPAIPAMEINGQLNRWIRVRIVSEKTYGSAGRFESKKIDDVVKSVSGKLRKSEKSVRDAMKGITFGFEYEAPAFNPPSLQSIKISYSYREAEFTNIKSLNNFHYRDIILTNSEEPYELSSDGMPALYFGFEENVANIPMTLFIAIKETLYSEKPVTIKDPTYSGNCIPEDEANGLVWKYYNGISWEEVNVEDETDSFKTGGIVRFLVPQEIEKTFEFERELYWIKVEVNEGMWASCPGLKGIFPNTVWALNNVTIQDEVLGSGNGEPDRTLAFSNKPLLEGQVIEVKEPDAPSKEELKIMESGGGGNALRIEEESGEITEVWVRWDEVGNFALSDPLSRHYILNRANGTITFGDGFRGMVPPRGKNNIIARQYRSGGGTRGEVAAGTITSLKKTIPNIDSVINHVSSSGGMDQEDLDSVVNRGPHTVKNRNRAVTKEDFEWLSEEASQYVARAKCMIANGTITIIIVPWYEGDAPLPDASLLGLVKRYLQERAFLKIRDKIEVVGPDYTTVDVCVSVKPVSVGETNILSKKIKERLKTFLHPLRGGQMGAGWDFGESLYVSQIATVIEGLENVDYVRKIVLTKVVSDEKEESVAGIKQLSIEQNALPCAGDISVEIRG